MEYLISEIALILVILSLITSLHRKVPSCAALLKGLIVYIPPDNEKISNALANPSKFILNCGYIDEKYAKNSPYYSDTEYLVLLSGFSAICVSFAIFLNYIYGFTLNTSFYLSLLVFIYSVKEAYNQFKSSGFRSPDNWMGLFYSMTLICFSSMLIYLDHQQVLDFNFHFSLHLLGLTLTSHTYRLFRFSISIHPLLFSILFSLFLGLMIFPYFRYFFRSTLNTNASSYSPFQVEGIQSISPYYKYTSILPLLITLSWVKYPSTLISQLLGEVLWEHTRIFIVLLYCLIRLYQLRTEVQVLLDQGKLLIYEIIRTKNQEERKEMETQCKVIGSYAWPTAHSSLACTFLIFSICFILLCKGEIYRPYPKPLIVTQHKVVEEYDENEFIVGNTAIVTPSMTVSYYKEIKDLEDLIKNQAKINESLEKTIESILKSQIVPCYFYRDFFEFMIWIYHLAILFAIGLTLLYRKRFTNKVANKALSN